MQRTHPPRSRSHPNPIPAGVGLTLGHSMGRRGSLMPARGILLGKTVTPYLKPVLSFLLSTADSTPFGCMRRCIS